MKIRRLKSSGALGAEPVQSGASDQVVKEGVLLHTGNFMCADGPIDFDDARIERVVLNHNAMIKRLAADYGGLDKMPIGAFPPILDHHEGESNDRVIGRLNGLLRAEKRDVPGVGKSIMCVIAPITFLGEDTVSKVNDGRIFHLSVGIDETTDTLEETSTVIEPAAPGARLLTGKHLAVSYRGFSIAVAKGSKPGTFKYTITQGRQVVRSSDGYATEEAALQNAKTLIDEHGSKLSKGANEMGKKLEATKARLTRLSALTATVTKLSTDNKNNAGKLKLIAAKSDVVAHLHGVLKAGKMTPAEFKKLSADGGLDRLAKLDKESLKTCLSAFESREKPVIEPGQRGSTDATDFSDLGREMGDSKIKRLKAETRRDVARLTGKKLADEDKEEKGAPAVDSPKKQLAADDEETKKKMGAYTASMGQLSKHLESGDVAGAKEEYKKLSALGYGSPSPSVGTDSELGVAGDVKSEDYRQAMSLMQEQIDALQTLMAKVMDELKIMTAEEEAEQAEMKVDPAAPGAPEKDPAALEAKEKPEPGKELAAEPAKEKADDKGDKKKPE